MAPVGAPGLSFSGRTGGSWARTSQPGGVARSPGPVAPTLPGAGASTTASWGRSPGRCGVSGADLVLGGASAAGNTNPGTCPWLKNAGVGWKAPVSRGNEDSVLDPRGAAGSRGPSQRSRPRHPGSLVPRGCCTRLEPQDGGQTVCGDPSDLSTPTGRPPLPSRGQEVGRPGPHCSPQMPCCPVLSPGSRPAQSRGHTNGQACG